METVSTPRADRHRIAQARIEAGLTQEELASKAACSVFSIGKYERGERALRGPRLRRIAEATGKPLAFFFTGSEVEAA